MSGKVKLSAFDWLADPGRGGLRTRYRPKARILSFFLVFVPWIDIMLLGFAFVALLHSRSIVPGDVVNLPGGVLHGGLETGHAVIVRSLNRSDDYSGVSPFDQDGASYGTALPHEINVMVFFDNERFNMSYQHRISSFYNSLREKVSETGVRDVLLYMDGGVEHADAVRLNGLFRSAGIERVCYVQKTEAAQ